MELVERSGPSVAYQQRFRFLTWFQLRFHVHKVNINAFDVGSIMVIFVEILLLFFETEKTILRVIVGSTLSLRFAQWQLNGTPMQIFRKNPLKIIIFLKQKCKV